MICVADLHLRGRDQIPRCRAEGGDTWMMHQQTRLTAIREAMGEKDCLIIAGDIFHTERVSHETVRLFIDTFIDC